MIQCIYIYIFDDIWYLFDDICLVGRLNLECSVAISRSGPAEDWSLNVGILMVQ